MLHRISRPSLVRGRLSVVALFALVAGCVGPEEVPSPGASREPARPLVGGSAETPGRSEPPPTEGTDDDLEVDDLEGLGELGVLPNLVQRALAPSSDCDFDDALSTCQ